MVIQNFSLERVIAKMAYLIKNFSTEIKTIGIIIITKGK